MTSGPLGFPVERGDGVRNRFGAGVSGVVIGDPHGVEAGGCEQPGRAGIGDQLLSGRDLWPVGEGGFQIGDGNVRLGDDKSYVSEETFGIQVDDIGDVPAEHHVPSKEKPDRRCGCGSSRLRRRCGRRC